MVEPVDTVVAVLEGRIHRQRGLEFRVRWAGSDGSDDEWFPAEAVEKDYPQLLMEFEDRTGWYPDENGEYPTNSSVGDDHSSYHSQSTLNQPMYSWKSESKPPPKMTKKELKESLKSLSKYVAGRNFTKNYADIAIEYRKQVKYIARSDDERNVVGAHPSSPPTCSMCKIGRCNSVFFPCQHACVCDDCIVKHEIGVLDKSNRNARTWNACPICVEEIIHIVPLQDNAQEQYFHWLHKSKPPIDYVDKKQFLFVGNEMLKINGVPNSLVDEHVVPKIKIGDWLSEEDMPLEEREKWRRRAVAERKRRIEESSTSSRKMENKQDLCCRIS